MLIHNYTLWINSFLLYSLKSKKRNLSASISNTLMNTYFQHVFNTGITTNLSLSEKRTIRFINFSLLFGLVFCLSCFVVNLVLMGAKESLFPLVFFFLFGIGFHYQKQHRFEWTKLFALSIAIFGVMISCWIFGLKGYPYFMFLLTFSIGMVFYPEKKQQFYLLGIHLFCLVFTLILSQFITPILPVPLPFTFGLLTFLLVQFLLFFIIYTYTDENQKFELKTNQLVNSLQQQKAQIEQQSIDLQVSNNQLQKEIAEKNIIQAQLETANEKLKQFTYVASHDLKEPLRSIGGFSTLLQMKLKGHANEASQEYLKFITGGVKRMTALLDDLLAYSRINNDTGAKVESIDLNQLINDLKRNLNHLILQNEGTILIEQSLPIIQGSPTQITQLFQNIISNGLKFKGDKAPLIHISYQEKESAYIFAIKDNGIGIPESQQSKIFTAFHRVDKSKYEGSGIGLATCEKVVENHNGKIWLDSELGKGSTFYFSIPNAAEPLP